jgi:hypothetical protein
VAAFEQPAHGAMQRGRTLKQRPRRRKMELEMQLNQMEMAAEELMPIPMLPSWKHMLDHLTGATPVQLPSAQRRSRKVTFETDDDRDSDF